MTDTMPNLKTVKWVAACSSSGSSVHIGRSAPATRRLALQLLVGVASRLAVPVRGNTFAPPVQLHECVHGAPMQQWRQDHNGSVYVLDVRGHTGYCLTTQPSGSAPKAGTQVYSADCAGLTPGGPGTDARPRQIVHS